MRKKKTIEHPSPTPPLPLCNGKSPFSATAMGSLGLLLEGRISLGFFCFVFLVGLGFELRASYFYHLRHSSSPISRGYSDIIMTQ
jgi:hypothetical protein